MRFLLTGRFATEDKSSGGPNGRGDPLAVIGRGGVLVEEGCVYQEPVPCVYFFEAPLVTGMLA
jgi:hypothetical protein